MQRRMRQLFAIALSAPVVGALVPAISAQAVTTSDTPDFGSQRQGLLAIDTDGDHPGRHRRRVQRAAPQPDRTVRSRSARRSCSSRGPTAVSGRTSGSTHRSPDLGEEPRRRHPSTGRSTSTPGGTPGTRRTPRRTSGARSRTSRSCRRAGPDRWAVLAGRADASGSTSRAT